MFVPNTDILDNRYLYHWLREQRGNILSISSGTGAQPNLSCAKMMELTIPVPPLEFQRAIVEQLDAFDVLCNDLCAGLPAEIDARRKEYEYYRDKLLNFNARGE